MEREKLRSQDSNNQEIPSIDKKFAVVLEEFMNCLKIFEDALMLYKKIKEKETK